MSESIARRVARLVSGSVNAMVNAVENSLPEAVMEQTIREIDSAINDTRTELGQQVAQKHLASKKLMEENSRHETLTEQLEAAIANGRDDLAEAGIAEQMDIEARIPVLENLVLECAAREKELDSYVQALQAKKREMKAELAAYVKLQAQKTANAVSSYANENSTERKVERATDTFGRVLEKATGISARETDMVSAAKLAELDELTRKNRISERLAALKSGSK